MLELFLFPRKMLCIVNGTLAYDDIRLFFKDRTNYLLNVRAAVLIVGVCIDDYIRSEVEASPLLRLNETIW